MRTKEEILHELQMHATKLDPQHQELAQVAMVETEVQIDIRDILERIYFSSVNLLMAIKGKQ